jgi:hypothetical protein
MALACIVDAQPRSFSCLVDNDAAPEKTIKLADLPLVTCVIAQALQYFPGHGHRGDAHP